MDERLICEKEDLVAIADAVRTRINSSEGMNILDIPGKILSITGGEGINTSDATIVSGDQMLSGVTAYGAEGKVIGTIPSAAAATLTPNDEVQVAIAAGTYAIGNITVNPVPTETKDVTVNGTYTPEDGKYFSEVTVNVPNREFASQSKIISPSTAQQIVTPDSGFDGLSSVTVNAMPNGDMNDITIDNNGLISVSVGTSGYLAEGTSKSLQINTQVGSTVTPGDNAQVIVEAETYVAGNITVAAVPTETKEITGNGVYTPTSGKYFKSVSVAIPEEVFETQTKSVTPTESQQVISPDNGYDGLSSVIVNAIASDYVGSTVVRENAKTVTPTKSAQIAVSAGTYVDGNVTVGAIPNEYITTTDATATSEEIFLNKTAYVKGEKVTGSFTIDSEVTEQEEKIASQDTLIADIVAALEGKAAGGGEMNFETSTVEVYDGGEYIVSISASIYKDGHIIGVTKPLGGYGYTSNETIENVIKGSYITVHSPGDDMTGFITGATEISIEDYVFTYRIDDNQARIGLASSNDFQPME